MYIEVDTETLTVEIVQMYLGCFIRRMLLWHACTVWTQSYDKPHGRFLLAII